MVTLLAKIKGANRRSVLTGLTVVAAVIVLGAGAAFATGTATPIAAQALEKLPGCCELPIEPWGGGGFGHGLGGSGGGGGGGGGGPTPLPGCCTETPPAPAPPPSGPTPLPGCCTEDTSPPPSGPTPLPGCCDETITPIPGPTPLPGCCTTTPPTIIVTPPPTIVTNPPPTVNPPPPENPPPPVVQSGRCLSLTSDRTFLTAPGQSVVLTWRTENVSSVTINNGVGTFAAATGSVTVNPTGNTTYVATVTGTNVSQSEACKVSVVLQPPPPPLSRCVSLTASDTRIDRGDEITLSWRTENASSAIINNGVGSVSPVAAGSVRVRPRDDTTYTLSVPGDENNPACRVRVSLEEERERDRDRDRNRSRDRDRDRDEAPLAFIDSTITPAAPPLASVYLSEIPYTGLDLGPVGTVFYWLMLALWSMAAAYLVIFTLVPAVFRRMAPAGSTHTSGDLPGWGSEAPGAHAPELSVAAPPAPRVHQAAHQAAVAHAMPAARPAAPAPRASVYSPHEGFKSFGENGALTIDDIVKGLSRESGAQVFDRREEEQPAPAPVREAAPRRAPAPVVKAADTVEYSDDIVDFIEALLDGNREHVFGTVRTLNKQGMDTEHFVSQTVCALDDAYRARVEGTEVHPEIERVTRDCHTSFLERLVSSLATAVDSSYSKGVTGTKLALTRALAVVNG